MALGHGTSKITDGLVFAYDMANTKKSWRGKPTINLLNNPDWSLGSDNNFTYWTRTDTVDISFTKSYYLGKKCIKLTRANGNIGFNGIRGSYLTQLQPNTQYTVTVSYAVPESMSQVLRFYQPEHRSDNSLIDFRHYLSAKNATDGWQKMTATFTTAADASYWSNFYIDWNTTQSTKTEIIYIEYVQVENNSFSSPFIFGTRSNTESILDLTSKYTLTANSLNYYSDNTFDFSTGNINIPYSSDFDFSLEQSIVMWIKPGTGASSARRNPYNQAYGGPGTITHEPSGVFNYYFGTNGGNSTPYVGRSSTFRVLENELAHIAVTRNQTTNTVRWYKNGQLISTLDAGSYPSTNNGSSPIIIGTGYTTNFIGQIPRVLVYKKELTPGQVLEDYQSTKGRYAV